MSEPVNQNSAISILKELLILQWTIICAVLRSIFEVFISPHEKCVRNQVVLITGGGNGIGRKVGMELAKKGATIVSWDVNSEWNQTTQELIEQDGGTVHTYTVDVSNRASVMDAAERVRREVGEIDILINNAGIMIGRSITDLTEDMITRTMTINFLAHFWTLQAFLPSMKARGTAHVVSIASLAGLAGFPKMSDYSASKFAVIGLHETLTMELCAENLSGIHTTLVCPAAIDTELCTGLKDRFHPLLDPDYVAKRITTAILTNQKVLYIPRDMYVVQALKVLLPVEAFMALMKFMGALNCMDTFKGRMETVRKED